MRRKGVVRPDIPMAGHCPSKGSAYARMCTGRNKHYYITGILLVIKTLGATSELLNWFKQIKSVLCLFRIACWAIWCISRYSEAYNYEQFQINTKPAWPWWINYCLLLKIVFLKSHYSPWLDLDLGRWREELTQELMFHWAVSTQKCEPQTGIT